MRRVPVVFLIVGMLQFTPGPASGDWVLSLFESYVEALRRQAGMPGLVAVVSGEHDVLWARGFGRPDLDQPAAAGPDTPFHIDGLTQIVTATLVLQCAEQGRLSLDDPIVPADPLNPVPVPTLRQVLTHTSGSPESPVYLYQPERFDALRPAVEACSGQPFRDAVASLLDSVSMNDTVPGADAIFMPPPEPSPLDPDVQTRYAATMARYTLALDRLATPYAVDPRGRATRSQYTAATLTGWTGLISTAADLARFDLALRNGVLVAPDTLASAWQTPLTPGQLRLPHGQGWFVQNVRGYAIAWQFGVGDGASSSLIVSVPARGITLILLANSDGLVRPFPLSNGDITVSPFARVFLGLFVP